MGDGVECGGVALGAVGGHRTRQAGTVGGRGFIAYARGWGMSVQLKRLPFFTGLLVLSAVLLSSVCQADLVSKLSVTNGDFENRANTLAPLADATQFGYDQQGTGVVVKDFGSLFSKALGWTSTTGRSGNAFLFHQPAPFNGSGAPNDTTVYGAGHPWETPESGENAFIQLRSNYLDPNGFGNVSEIVSSSINFANSGIGSVDALALYTVQFSFANVKTDQRYTNDTLYSQGIVIDNYNLADDAIFKVVLRYGGSSVELESWSGAELRGLGRTAGGDYNWVALTAGFANLDETQLAELLAQTEVKLAFILDSSSESKNSLQNFVYNEQTGKLEFYGAGNYDSLYVDNVGFGVIPEPTTWVAMLGIGAVGLVMARRSRRKAAR